MTEILQVHITAVRRHPAVRQATTPEAAAADTAEAAQEAVEATAVEATAAEAVAVPVAEEDSTTIKTDIQ